MSSGPPVGLLTAVTVLEPLLSCAAMAVATSKTQRNPTWTGDGFHNRFPLGTDEDTGVENVIVQTLKAGPTHVTCLSSFHSTTTTNTTAATATTEFSVSKFNVVKEVPRRSVGDVGILYCNV
jgi:hypothetical protein